MMLKDFYSKYKYIIWPIISGLSSIIILVFVIIPQILTYMNIKNQISDILNRSSFLDAKAAELYSLDEIAAQEDLKVVFTVLPADQDVLTALSALQNLVIHSGLRLENTSFSSSRQKDNKSSFQLNLTVFGQTNSLRDFLIKIQDSSRVFQVESISAQFLKSKSAIEAEIPISVFYQGVPKVLGSVDQKVPKLSDQEKQLLGRLTNIISQTTATSGAAINDASVPLGKSNPFE